MNHTANLNQQGIELQAEGEHLIVESPFPLTDKQRDFIRTNKHRLLLELHQQQAANDSTHSIQPLEPVLYCAYDLIGQGLPLIVGQFDDTGFIDGILAYRSEEERHILLTGYLEQWQAAADTEPLQHRKANSGRHEANTWLRVRLH